MKLELEMFLGGRLDSSSRHPSLCRPSSHRADRMSSKSQRRKIHDGEAICASRYPLFRYQSREPEEKKGQTRSCLI